MAKCIGCGRLSSEESTFCSGCGQRLLHDPEPTGQPDTPLITNGGRLAGIIALVGFVLPWVNCGGDSTGLELANRPGNSFLWIVPISLAVALTLLFTSSKTFRQLKNTAGGILLSDWRVPPLSCISGSIFFAPGQM